MSEAAEKSGFLRLLPVAIFAAIAVMFAMALMGGDPSKLPSALIGKPVPVSDFPPVDGLQTEGKSVPGFASGDLGAGKVSVVNFWASWCAPCVEEHPLLAQLNAATGVPIFGVNYKDDAAAARRFLSRYGNPFTAVGTDSDGRRAIDWGVYGMPETFVVGRNGEIIYKHVGPISAQSLAEKLIPVIEKAKAPTG